MIRIEIDVSDFIRAERQLEEYENALFRNRSLLHDILRDLRQYEQEVFDTWGHGQWPDYYETFEDPHEAEKYMEWKEKQPGPGGAADLLVLSGKLMKSLTQRTADSIVVLNPRHFTFGTKVRDKNGRPYAHYHMDHDFPPAYRPFLQWNPRMQTMVERRVQEYIDRRNRRFFT